MPAMLPYLLCLPLVGISPPDLQDVRISEFLAINDLGLQDQDGEYSDWLEIVNLDASPVALGGWYLTDDSNQLDGWRFPSRSLSPGEFLVVFASGKNRVPATGELHTDFKLKGDGEYLALVKPDGATIAHAFAPAYPPQHPDTSYGLPFRLQGDPLLLPGSPVRARIPQDGSLGWSWIQPAFDDGNWIFGNSGAGFDLSRRLHPFLGLDLEPLMHGQANGAYLRFPFQLPTGLNVQNLWLRMRYDDGFAAFLNGTAVASQNLSQPLKWYSAANQARKDGEELLVQTWDLSSQIHLLNSGPNVLAMQGANVLAEDDDFLVLPELWANPQWTVEDRNAFFGQPSPGQANDGGGPWIGVVQHQPNQPSEQEPLVVEAQADLQTSVTLEWQVQFGPWQQSPMLDDGTGPDRVSGDGIFTALIPSSAYSAGQRIRYAVLAEDSLGGLSRWPPFSSGPDLPRSLGTVVLDPSVQSPLPVLSWFLEDPQAANSRIGTTGSVFFRGKFYDQVFFRSRGGSSIIWRKKNFKFEFQNGNYFEFDPRFEPVEEFNLNSTFSDKSYMRQVLSYETYRDAGMPYSECFPLRVQQNGQFYSVAVFVEQPDEIYLRRNNLDPDGALYKMYNTLSSATNGVEKKTRRDEDHQDLQDLVTALGLPGPDREIYLFDNVDLASCINYLAVTSLIHDNDHVAKNYYLYRDTEGDGEWTFLPWDKDLTFGRNFGAGGGVLSDGIWADDDPYSHPEFGTKDYQKYDNLWNRLIHAMHRRDAILEMYLRRLRTLMDQLLNEASIPPELRHFENRIAELKALLQSDVELDRQEWGNPYGQNQDLDAAVDVLLNDYLTVRRKHLFETHGGTPSDFIPDAQSFSPPILFGEFDWNPVSGNQEEEYIELINPNAQSVDLSGWRLRGDVEFTMPPGTVIRGQDVMYLSPHLPDFRSRSQAPTGGLGLYVQGPYQGKLSSEDPDLRLFDTAGNLIASRRGPLLWTSVPRAGEPVRITVAGSTPGAWQWIGLSWVGGGPTWTPWGSTSLSPPITTLALQAADVSGSWHGDFFIPPSAAGLPVWLQAFDHGSTEWSPGLNLTVQ